jgi:hypothetical protein
MVLHYRFLNFLPSCWYLLCKISVISMSQPSIAFRNVSWGWGHGSSSRVVECLLSIYEALGSIPSTTNTYIYKEEECTLLDCRELCISVLVRQVNQCGEAGWPCRLHVGNLCSQQLSGQLWGLHPPPAARLLQQ